MCRSYYKVLLQGFGRCTLPYPLQICWSRQPSKNFKINFLFSLQRWVFLILLSMSSDSYIFLKFFFITTAKLLLITESVLPGLGTELNSYATKFMHSPPPRYFMARNNHFFINLLHHLVTISYFTLNNFLVQNFSYCNFFY